MRRPTDRTIFQNCWVIDDIDKSAMDWVETMGVGPFFFHDYIDAFEKFEYRGQPAALDFRLGIAQAGPIQVELVQVLSEGPNIYRDIQALKGPTYHHICVWTDDYEADCRHYEAMGCPVATKARVKDFVNFAYIDAFEKLGCMIEIVERSPAVDELFQSFVDAAENWDGKDPIRYF